MHTARDDARLERLKFVSKDQKSQIYGALLPDAMTNAAMRETASYKTYLSFASGVQLPKAKRLRKTESKSLEDTATRKSPRLKSVAKKPTQKTKKKSPVKLDTGKGLAILSDVALSDV